MVADLRAVLEKLEEVSSCSGTCRPTERVAIALPDGDVGAVDDPNFVRWLMEHAEPAPYGEGGETKIDPAVRKAHRLIARDAAEIHGFDVAAIANEVAAALQLGTELEARLTDVIVYGKGGKFARHKDTPRSTELVGTLVVGLPIEHAGGAFIVDDGRGEKTFDWSGKPDPAALPWVALFSDVDHEIKPVKSGTRVTAVFSLHRTSTLRGDQAIVARREALQRAVKNLAPPRWPLMIACGRRMIAEPEEKQPQGIESLNGVDREIADALVAAGYRVAVRACVAPVPEWGEPVARGPFPDLTNMWAITRLKAVPPPSVFEGMNDEGSAGDMEDYMHDSLPMDQWLIRRTAGTTLVQDQGMWTETGYFGNEGYSALLYTLAALEVSPGKKPSAKPAKSKTKPARNITKPQATRSKPTKAAKPKAAAKAKPKPKPKKKR